jgi:hypothetical protein
MHVTTRVDSGSAVKRTVAEFDIHRVNARCETDYLGRVYLDGPATDVGIPVGGLIYLDFIFASKAFMSTTTSAIRYQTTFTPRHGYEYHAKVDYDRARYRTDAFEQLQTGKLDELNPGVEEIPGSREQQEWRLCYFEIQCRKINLSSFRTFVRGATLCQAIPGHRCRRSLDSSRR